MKFPICSDLLQKCLGWVLVAGLVYSCTPTPSVTLGTAQTFTSAEFNYSASDTSTSGPKTASVTTNLTSTDSITAKADVRKEIQKGTTTASAAQLTGITFTANGPAGSADIANIEFVIDLESSTSASVANGGTARAFVNVIGTIDTLIRNIPLAIGADQSITAEFTAPTASSLPTGITNKKDYKMPKLTTTLEAGQTYTATVQIRSSAEVADATGTADALGQLKLKQINITFP